MTETNTQAVPAPVLFDAEQASARLGTGSNGKPPVSAYWLKGKAGFGLVPCTGIGDRSCWSEQQLLNLIEQQRSKGPGTPVCDRCRKPR